jgi:hypothetical protein
MTRAEKITELLQSHGVDYLDSFEIAELADQVLAMADDRELVTLQEFGRLIGRSPNTIITWMVRRNVVLPEPAYRIARGPLWDRVDIDQWVGDHPEEVR